MQGVQHEGLEIPNAELDQIIAANTDRINGKAVDVRHEDCDRDQAANEYALPGFGLVLVHEQVNAEADDRQGCTEQEVQKAHQHSRVENKHSKQQCNGRYSAMKDSGQKDGREQS